MKKILVILLIVLSFTLGGCSGETKHTLEGWALKYAEEEYNKDYDGNEIISYQIENLIINPDAQNDYEDYIRHLYQITIINNSGKSTRYNVLLVYDHTSFDSFVRARSIPEDKIITVKVEETEDVNTIQTENEQDLIRLENRIEELEEQLYILGMMQQENDELEQQVDELELHIEEMIINYAEDSYITNETLDDVLYAFEIRIGEDRAEEFDSHEVYTVPSNEKMLRLTTVAMIDILIIEYENLEEPSDEDTAMYQTLLLTKEAYMVEIDKEN